MACLSFPQFYSIPRLQASCNFSSYIKFAHFHHIGLESRWILTAVSKKKITEASTQESSDGEAVVEKSTRRRSKRAAARTRKEGTTENVQNGSLSGMDGNVINEEAVTTNEANETSKKTQLRKRSKAASNSGKHEEVVAEKTVRRRRRTKKQINSTVGWDTGPELSDQEVNTFLPTVDDDSEEEMELQIDGGEDISFTYGWPPLVCCFGAAQHAFVPSGRRANRLVDHEMHERRKNAIWAPEKFVRAPGGCASNVAVALASLGGKVAFMGKLGDDDYGQSLLYFLNVNKVQTRSVRIDGRRITAVSHMKVGKRGGLRMTNVKPCAEDSLSESEINIDVLKEAKMFYFNTFSLLDQKMQSTALQAIKISKRLGGVIFYDLNLPLPLWQSGEETKAFIQQAWDLADIIEVSKQELEFLSGIKPSEKFDTKDNDRSKFTHYAPEAVAPLWHENLKVLFVTNGTSKIHYYTREDNGAVLGMEDAPLTPYTSDMSASGDGVIAGIMRMLTVQPHLLTDKKYLERTIKYAISCGVIDQWLQARTRGFPPKEGLEEEVIADPNGIKSITERQYQTLVPVG